jgi:hypothetical protein
MSDVVLWIILPLFYANRSTFSGLHSADVGLGSGDIDVMPMRALAQLTIARLRTHSFVPHFAKSGD